MRFFRTKRKDLCMIDLEKQDFMEIMEVEISVHMRLTHMNSSMHSSVVLTRFLGAWVQGDFITVQMSRITGGLMFAMIFSFLLKNQSLDANGRSVFFVMKHVALAMDLEVNLAIA